MWFSTRGFLKIKLKALTLEQLADLRRDITAALILATEETENRYRAALARTEGHDTIDEARNSLARRADYLQAARSFLWADFLWPTVASAEDEQIAILPGRAPGSPVTGRLP